MIFQGWRLQLQFLDRKMWFFCLLGRSPHLGSGEIAPIYKPFRPFGMETQPYLGYWRSPWLLTTYLNEMILEFGCLDRLDPLDLTS